MATNTAYTQTPSDGTGPQGQVMRAQGHIAYPATAIVAADSTVVTCGFRPKKVTFINLTDRITAEWYYGMADNSCIKTAANGTRTLEVTGGNGGITLTSDGKGFSVLQNATLAVIAASKNCAWIAEA